MKTALLIIFLTTAIPLMGIGCSCDRYSFCVSKTAHTDHNVFSAKVISHDSNSIKVIVIDLLSGIENRDTVVIWDQTGDCGMGLETSSSKWLGQISDTIVVSLALINSNNTKNWWDVVGDYRTEYTFDGCHTHVLSVTNDSVYGKIWMHLFAPYPYSNTRLKYSEFVTSWLKDDGNCADLTTIEEKKISSARITTANKSIHIEGHGDLSIYNLTGQRLHHAPLIGKTSIALDKGIYLVRVMDGGRSVTKKVYLD